MAKKDRGLEDGITEKVLKELSETELTNIPRISSATSTALLYGSRYMSQ